MVRQSTANKSQRQNSQPPSAQQEATNPAKGPSVIDPDQFTTNDPQQIVAINHAKLEIEKLEDEEFMNQPMHGNHHPPMKKLPSVREEKQDDDGEIREVEPEISAEERAQMEAKGWVFGEGSNEPLYFKALPGSVIFKNHNVLDKMVGKEVKKAFDVGTMEGEQLGYKFGAKSGYKLGRKEGKHMGKKIGYQQGEDVGYDWAKGIYKKKSKRKWYEQLQKQTWNKYSDNEKILASIVIFAIVWTLFIHFTTLANSCYKNFICCECLLPGAGFMSCCPLSDSCKTCCFNFENACGCERGAGPTEAVERQFETKFFKNLDRFWTENYAAPGRGVNGGTMIDENGNVVDNVDPALVEQRALQLAENLHHQDKSLSLDGLENFLENYCFTKQCLFWCVPCYIFTNALCAVGAASYTTKGVQAGSEEFDYKTGEMVKSRVCSNYWVEFFLRNIISCNLWSCCVMGNCCKEVKQDAEHPDEPRRENWGLWKFDPPKPVEGSNNKFGERLYEIAHPKKRNGEKKGGKVGGQAINARFRGNSPLQPDYYYSDNSDY